ncbi:uncharacterized protein LOC111660422 [Seriola lalandi dorsalis]|uniref:uncharacterized protein LOC111660422 n=1 Tax=Seriola lalandi dorsalis TaxID=1841481 RepID=UPI000C6F8EF7|nr:uncharacterized protein LOC111660422 [Seriola lalandi dorsalis]
MSFANLFTRLSAVDEDVTSPGQTSITHRNESVDGQRGNARKRKTQGEQTGPDKKKRYRGQTKWTYNTASFEDDNHVQNTDNKPAGFGFTKEMIHNHSDKAGHNNMYHRGQNYKARNNRNVSKQLQKKRTEENKHQHQQKDKWRHTNRGGRHQTGATARKGGGDGQRRDGKQDVQVKRPRFMTDEFKDMNALLVDGRLLCRHFLWGRCIKGDDCQLEHIQGHNDLIKEACKFYIQGFCMKGESCVYMHKSFPCKFFHKKGKCSQGADCKFSHEPLNEITNRLLDEVLKRENDLYELRKKTEQESQGEPANTDGPEITDADQTPDIVIQPVRPTFYNSGEKNAEQEALLCPTEQPSDNNTADPPQASHSAHPHSPPSTNLNHKEPVCYSVEAVLGPQLFKPFPSFYTTPGSEESAPLSVAHTSSDCAADQSEAPYSVSFFKSVGNSTFGQIPAPPTAHNVSYTSKTDNKELTDPLVRRNEANKSQEKMFNSLSCFQVHTVRETCPDLTLACEDHDKRGGEMPASQKPALRSSHEVKPAFLDSPATEAEKSVSSKRKGDLKGGTHLPVDIITHSVKCKSEPRKGKSLTFTPKHPTQLKPHLSGLTSNSQSLLKLLCPSSGFSEFKGRAAVPAESVTSSAKTSGSGNCVSHHLAARQPTEIHQPSKQTQPGLKLDAQQHYFSETSIECSSKTAPCGDLSDGCNKTQKSQYYSLHPITDSLKPTPDFISACPQGFNQSSCPTLQPAHYRSKDKEVKTDKASAFHSLFAAPLSAAPHPCTQSQPDHSNQSADHTSQLSNSKQKASTLETPLPPRVKTNVKQTSHRPTSPKFSCSPQSKNDLSGPVNQPAKQQVNPVCSLVSNSLSETSSSPPPCDDSTDPSPALVHQQLPDVSSPKATANSVLKTLFLSLSPYQQDGEQQDSVQTGASSESEKKHKGSTGCVFVEQQQKSNKKKRRKKQLMTQSSHQQSTEKTVAHSRGRQPSFQTSLISVEAAVGSTLSSPATTEPQVRKSGTHNLPFKPAVQLMQRHNRQRLKHTLEEGKRENGKVAVTPLKDLFKSLDTSVFHLGH